ncbi:Neopentalenolactone D synthase [Aspergillus californicus]
MPAPRNGTTAPLSADVKESIETKIIREREKRINKKGIHQFREATGELAKFAADPWAKADSTRLEVDEDVDVLIIGCGFGGVLAAKKLHDAGIHRIRMVDKASDFGGVWYWNRYPGLCCDTEAYIYLPLLEETGHVPSAKYVPGYEIQAHIRKIAEMDDLRPRTLFQTELNAITWSQGLGRWVGNTDRGDTIRARFVVSAIGILHKVHLPGIPGIENFKGHSFHSSRWDYEYTGGNRDGTPLDRLEGRRVGLVGTGASTIQALPHLAVSGAEVFVFQRTPSSVDRRDNVKTDAAWFSSFASKPGWQYDRINNFDAVFNGVNPGLDLVNDGWTQHIFALHGSKGDDSFESRLEEVEFRKMEEVRHRVDRIVQDPKTAEGLKAWYKRGCKRPLFNDEYLPAFNMPNVHLVNTDGKGIERVTEQGLVAGEVEHKLDCIIYATGFDWGNDYSQRANMTVTGRHAITLTEKWAAGPSTFHGMLSRDFPNLLLFTHLQSSTSPNYTHLLQERAKHAAYIICKSMQRGVNTVEPTQEAEDSWVEKLEDIAIKHLEFFRQCTPGYLNQEGQISATNLRSAPVGMATGDWGALTAQWRAEGNMEGLEFDRLARI